jgi:hypothetical protein
VPVHKAASVCQFITPKNVTTLYQTPYSPPEYFLFPMLKMNLKDLQFMDDAEIQEAVNNEWKKVQKEKFSASFQKKTAQEPVYKQKTES